MSTEPSAFAMSKKRDKSSTTGLERYVDSGAIADLLGVDESTVRRWSAQKVLPGVTKVGGVWRYRLSVLERWLEAGGELSEMGDEDE